MPTFMEDGPVSSLTVRMAPRGDGNHAIPLPKASGEQISTYVEVVNYLLKAYPTDANIAEATSEVASLKKAHLKTSVHFANVLPAKVVRGGNAYPKRRTESIFIDGLPTNAQSADRLFWV